MYINSSDNARSECEKMFAFSLESFNHNAAEIPPVAESKEAEEIILISAWGVQDMSKS